MKEKVIQNKRIIILIASIVSAALLVPSFINFFGNPANDVAIILVITYALLALTNLVFIIYFITKKDIDLKALIIPFILFTAAGMLEPIFGIIQADSWSSIFFLALYASVLILFLIYYFNNNKMIKIALYILSLICMAFSLLDVFGSSNVELSRLITNLILIGSIYFIPEGGEQK